MPAHAAATDFPLTLEALQEWDAIILSDIGANTLLLHPDTWLKSRRTANRLTLLHDYVAGGGALMMIGGYYSFQGINGGARPPPAPGSDRPFFLNHQNTRRPLRVSDMLASHPGVEDIAGV